MKAIILALLLTLLSEQGYAQTGRHPISRWSVNLEALTHTAGVYAESVRLPGIRTQFSGGKGLQLGVEYVYLGGKRGQFFQNITLLKYGSKKETGLGAATSLGYRRRFGAAFVEGQAGVGYWQTTFPDGRELQTPNGDFLSEKFKVAGLTPSVALGAGYQLNKSWKVYLRYYHHAQLQTELNPGGVRLHRSLNLGLGSGLGW